MRRPTKPPRRPEGAPGRGRATRTGDKHTSDKRKPHASAKRADQRGSDEKRFGKRRHEDKPQGEKRLERREGRGERSGFNRPDDGGEREKRVGERPKSRRSGAREQERSQRREKPRNFAPRAAEKTVDKAIPRDPPRRERVPSGERLPARDVSPVAERVGALVDAIEALPSAVQTVTVTADENDMRVDRFLEARFSGLSFSHIQRIVRKGELRVNGRRADSKDRLKAGQAVRIPPLKLDAPKARESSASEDEKTRAFLKSITLYEDDDVLVLNKPYGLAVQGGSGTTRHVDGMLDALRDRSGQKPRLVHRIDKDTSGCLLVAKTRFAASALAKSFRSRDARKIYWALVAGVPRPHQGRISTYLAKEEIERDSFMRVAQHGEDGASHAITYYAVVETAAQKLAWISLKPVTGRTHQLRAHCAHIEHPIVGDPKYFSIENWELPGGIQNRLHLLARRIVLPHPRGGVIDVSAPLPPHMRQSWNLLGFDADRYDPIVEAPEK